MQSDLPIVLAVSSESLLANTKLTTYLKQTEAWLNFQGLKAQWYGNERNIFELSFTVLDKTDFSVIQTNSNLHTCACSSPVMAYYQLNSQCFSIYILCEQAVLAEINQLELSAITPNQSSLTLALVNIANKLMTDQGFRAI